jgi:autotransporter-associated beta strand protein
VAEAAKGAVENRRADMSFHWLPWCPTRASRACRSGASRRPPGRPLALESLERRDLLAGGVPALAHVVIVIDENHDYSGPEGMVGNPDAPYLNSLIDGPNAALFTQSFGLIHPSQPDYFDLFAGDDQGVTDDGVPDNLPFTTPNFGAALIAKGWSFTGYAEDLPSVGFTGAVSGDYASKHCPWVNWQGTGPNDIPAVDNQPFTAFPTDYNQLPTVSFVIPNMYDDMHTPPPSGIGSIAAGDTWLKDNLDGYIQWAKTHNSLLILTFDEDASDQTGADTQRIFTMFVGAMVQQGQYGEYIDHYNVLRTIEDMYGLPYAGHSTTAAPVTDVWSNSTPPDLIQGTHGNDVVRIACEAGNPNTVDVFFNAGPTPTFSLPWANLTHWQVTGAADELTVDFSNGDPLPAGGLLYDGGTYVTGDSLIIQGTSGDDTVIADADGITVDGSAAISYSNVQSVGFNLGAGQDSLSVDGITLPANAAPGISSGTAVTIQGGGTLDLGGSTNTVRGLTLASGSVVDGTLLSSSFHVVQSGTVSAGLTGPAGLLKNTAGTVTLSGTNEYTGGTTVSAGVLLVENSAAIPGGSLLSIGADGSVVLGAPSFTELAVAPGDSVPPAAADPPGSGSGAAVLGSGSGSVVEPTIARAALGSITAASPGIVEPVPAAAVANRSKRHDVALRSVIFGLSSVEVLGLSELAYSQCERQRHKHHALAEEALDAMLARVEW